MWKPLVIVITLLPVFISGRSASSHSLTSSFDLDSLDLNLIDHVFRSARIKRSPTVEERPSCGGGETNSAIDTTDRLSRLRELMADTSVTHASKAISVFYLPMDDAHQSEYVAESDKRIEFISGFTGSSGRALVSTTQAALWTDGRYFLQGEAELDCNWILMKHQQPDVPSSSAWLLEILSSGDIVGADPTQMSYDSWVALEQQLQEHSIDMVEVPNLVDLVWEELGTRPAQANGPLEALGIQYAGLSWSEKVEQVREHMDGKADVAVFTALDDNAWLFNLRGTDIAYNPFFFSYSIVAANRVTLFLRNPTDLLTDEVRNHLNWPDSGECTADDCVHVEDYDSFFEELATISGNTAGSVWFSPMSSYAVFSRIGNDIYKATSIVRDLKGRKNAVEREGLRRCHIRDSAALIEFIQRLEMEVQEGKYWDEITASDELERIRRMQENNRGLSFATISGSGSNGAIIHYKASNATKRPITTSDMYLVDSGGQFLDGTTDVTRTFHFGNPTAFQKEAYTRVLMAAINLATAVWPTGLYGHQLDMFARRPLWEAGLDYRHGTGHGIGMFLGVHEGPGRINLGYRPSSYESKLYPYMFFSDEPGYYEDGEFGIRLETIVMVKVVETEHRFNDVDYLGFEEFTLVPFEPNLIKYEMLNPEMRKWLNRYNAKVRSEVAEKVLKPAGKTAAYEWVMRRTEPIGEDPNYDSSQAHPAASLLMVLMCAAVAWNRFIE